MKAEQALFAVTRLDTFKRDVQARVTSKLASATGFFYKSRSGSHFLVTNKHVLYNRADHSFPDRLRLHVHTDPKYFTKMRSVDLRLWSRSGEKLWRSPKDRRIDVAALKVPERELEGCFYLYFTEGDLLDVGDEFLPGRHIDIGVHTLVLGYPHGFYDVNTFLPIARAGTVATWPWLDFEGKPCFLIDAKLHPGMSGSPVLSSSGAIHKSSDSAAPGADAQESYLLGVFSDEWTYRGEPLGLNTIWHAAPSLSMLEEE
ncbi:MAG: serine protease [Chloroflexota bacterium]|nr:serine protease [Chloroflexota bacterium]